MSYEVKKKFDQVQNTSDLESIIAPEVGDQCLVQSDGSLNVFDGTRWNKFNQDFNNTGLSNNWILIDQKKFSNQVIDYTISCNSDIDDKYMIITKLLMQ